MGACTSTTNEATIKQDSIKSNIISIPNNPIDAKALNLAPAASPSNIEDLKYFPDFHYFNRGTGQVLSLTKSSTTEIIIKSKLIFPQESAICYLSNQSLLIVGGVIKSRIVSLVVLINLSTQISNELPSLPISCKQGQLHEIKDWVYYIGGVCAGKSGLTQAPLLRYNLKQNLWQDLINYGEQFKFNSIMNMGTCAFRDKLLLVGGHRFSKKLKKLKNSKKIYSIAVENGFKVELEAKLPCKLLKTGVVAGSKNCLITGGVQAKTMQPNHKSFSLVWRNDIFQVEVMDDIAIDLSEAYPPIYTKDYAMFLSYPNIAVRMKHVKQWICYGVTGRNSRVLIEKKHPDLEIPNTESSEESERIELDSKRSVSGKMMNKEGKITSKYSEFFRSKNPFKSPYETVHKGVSDRIESFDKDKGFNTVRVNMTLSSIDPENTQPKNQENLTNSLKANQVISEESNIQVFNSILHDLNALEESSILEEFKEVDVKITEIKSIESLSRSSIEGTERSQRKEEIIVEDYQAMHPAPLKFMKNEGNKSKSREEEKKIDKSVTRGVEIKGKKSEGEETEGKEVGSGTEESKEAAIRFSNLPSDESESSHSDTSSDSNECSEYENKGFVSIDHFQDGGVEAPAIMFKFEGGEKKTQESLLDFGEPEEVVFNQSLPKNEESKKEKSEECIDAIECGMKDQVILLDFEENLKTPSIINERNIKKLKDNCEIIEGDVKNQEIVLDFNEKLAPAVSSTQKPKIEVPRISLPKETDTPTPALLKNVPISLKQKVPGYFPEQSLPKPPHIIEPNPSFIKDHHTLKPNIDLKLKPETKQKSLSKPHLHSSEESKFKSLESKLINHKTLTKQTRSFGKLIVKPVRPIFFSKGIKSSSNLSKYSSPSLSLIHPSQSSLNYNSIECKNSGNSTLEMNPVFDASKEGKVKLKRKFIFDSNKVKELFETLAKIFDLDMLRIPAIKNSEHLRLLIQIFIGEKIFTVNQLKIVARELYFIFYRKSITEIQMIKLLNVFKFTKNTLSCQEISLIITKIYKILFIKFNKITRSSLVN